MSLIFFLRSTRVFWAAGCIRATNNIGEPSWPIPGAFCPSRAAVGGAKLVSGLMNMGLIDEVRFLVNPFILGGGKALFKDVKDRHVLKLVQAKAFKSGKVNMTYITQPDIKVLDSEKRW
jgi:dihydrofolate reductase